ncbi:hypothetical protein GE09DRAFT_514370 [Coniochaeta sp. 2T2.1]|nr:hypothetical protein GE09DRAFT_514370 [Coniochaeta sp. 2T2.1]
MSSRRLTPTLIRALPLSATLGMSRAEQILTRPAFLSGLLLLDQQISSCHFVVAIISPGCQTPANESILISASPVFKAMFSPRFTEGEQILKGERPTIALQEDDPDAMRTILRILHFQADELSLKMSRATFASVAIQVDKYDCRRALRGWTRAVWHTNMFDELQGVTSTDIGLTVLAAYKLRFRNLPKIATNAMEYLKSDFLEEWEQHETLSPLPEDLTGHMHEQITRELQYLRGRLYEHEYEFLDEGVDRGCQMKGRVCPPWFGNILQVDVLMRPRTHCTRCSEPLVGQWCMRTSRLSEYLNTLIHANLYPLDWAFRDHPMHEILESVRDLSITHYHKCDGGTQCPLVSSFLSQLRDAEEHFDRVKAVQFNYGIEDTPRVASGKDTPGVASGV